MGRREGNPLLIVNPGTGASNHTAAYVLGRGVWGAHSFVRGPQLPAHMTGE